MEIFSFLATRRVPKEFSCVPGCLIPQKTCEIANPQLYLLSIQEGQLLGSNVRQDGSVISPVGKSGFMLFWKRIRRQQIMSAGFGSCGWYRTHLRCSWFCDLLSDNLILFQTRQDRYSTQPNILNVGAINYNSASAGWLSFDGKRLSSLLTIWTSWLLAISEVAACGSMWIFVWVSVLSLVERNRITSWQLTRQPSNHSITVTQRDLCTNLRSLS